MRLSQSRSAGFAGLCLLAWTAQLHAAVHIGTSSLPDGFVGTAYNQTLSANGGTAPYSWSLSVGQLPAGLSLSGSGVISGTPAAPGSSLFGLQVKDADGNSSAGSLTIVIDPAISISTTSLPGAIVGLQYSQNMMATGGTLPFQWAVSSGSLPAGLGLGATGTLSGTPSASGNFSFSVDVKDSKGATDTVALTLAVAAAVSITTTSLPGGEIGIAYSQGLAGSGGTGSYIWSLSAGGLPAGLGLSIAGVISGTPSATGTTNFTVKASSGGSSSTQSLSISVAPAVTVGTSSLPAGEVGLAYQQALTANGGTGGYSWTVKSGSPPAGLTLNPSGTLSGTPSASGTANFTVQVTDSSSAKATANLSIAVNAALTIGTSSLPGGVAGTPYQQTLTASGGSGGNTWTVTAGAPPAGLNLSAAGVITGTPSSAGTANFTVQVADSLSAKATANLSITVGSALTVGTSSLPAAVIGTAYQQTLTATGGTGGYSWKITASSLPAGLSLSAAGAITGTPTTAGTASFTVQVTDSSSAKATANLSIVVGPPLSIGTSSLPGGVVGTAYQQTLTASGGTGGYSWTVTSGAVPAGLTLSAGGVIGGTPSSAGTASFTVQVTDSSSAKAAANLSIVVGPPLTIGTSSLPGGVIGTAYQQTLLASGGTGGYSWTVTNGTLPAGLTLSAAGAIAGTPSSSAGTANFTVQVTDSSSAKATATLSIAVTAALTIGTSSLPAAVVGTAYQQTLTASGGTGGYTWSVTSGAVPAGLTLNAAGAISGTPSSAGTAAFIVQVADSSSAKTTANLSIVVGPALAIGTSSLSAGVVGVAYQQTLSASGGTGGYSWTVTSGAVPGGLTLNASGAISGTPSSAGTATFTVQVTDSSSAKATANLSIVVGAGLTVGTASLPPGVVGVAYQQTLAAIGGTGGYTWTVTTGAVPAGLALSAAGTVSGTPSSVGTGTFTVQVTDSSSAKATANLSIVVGAALSIGTTSLPAGIVGTAYQQTLTAGGGTGGYTWSVTTGAVPAGLTLSAAGIVSGTPSSAGTATFTVQVTDSSSAKAAANLSIVVGAGLTIGTASLPPGIVGTAYQQTLTASGGTGGYSWTVASGALPAGLTLSAAGVIGGTPSSTGTAGFTVQVTDSSSAKITAPLSIVVGAALTVSTASLPSAIVGTAYQQTLSASGGAGGNSWTVTKGALPAGLTLSAAGAIAGTPSSSGTATFTVQVTDSSSAKATANLTIVVGAGLTIVTTSLPAAVLGSPYQQTLAAGGGTGGYSWTVTAGALPAGLTFSASGAIGGTPSAIGTASFVVQVTDSSTAKATANLSIAVGAALTIGTSASLPAGVIGTPYQLTLTASGGTGVYSWNLNTGTLPAGLALSADGIISGTPSSAGTANFIVQVTDSNSQRTSASLVLTINAALSVVTSTGIAGGSLGAAYSQTFTAQGGAPPYTWQITGTLPSGLTLAVATGILSGTPTQSGTFPIVVNVSDASGKQASATYSLVIAAGLTISTPPGLPAATVGAAYTTTLQASGGTSPYQWAVTAGSLPAGLNFSGQGSLSGTPTSSGAFTITVDVTDANSNRASKQFTLAVVGAITITSTTLPDASTQSQYSQTLTAAGGTPPYSWSVTAGALPNGLSLQPATGLLSGTPASTGAFNFTVTVTDANSATATQQFSITVGQGVAITTASTLPAATAGVSYAATLHAAGGTPPYAWSLSQGSLPGGLTLDAAAGTIAGTPNAPGTFNFTVRATDAAKAAGTALMSIVVATPTLPSLAIGGFSGNMAPLQQPAVQVTFSQPYPIAISGTLSLAFTPGGPNGIDDPSIQFSTGGRTAAFTIAANSLQATFTAPQLAVQTGSVQGAITLSVVSLQANGAALPVPAGLSQTVTIAAGPPSISAISVVQTAGGIQVQIIGVADTRELTQVTVSFQPSAGSTVQTQQLTVSLTSAAATWFSSATAAAYGGQFSLSLPFSFSGSVSLSNVSAILSSGGGNSPAASANF